MLVNGTPYRSIWTEGSGVRVIDQRRLPHAFEVAEIDTCQAATAAIREMWVRGAPLIGATAAWGIALAARADPSDAMLEAASAELTDARPTAVNLAWALQEMRRVLAPLPTHERAAAAWVRATEICETDVTMNRAIGDHGLGVLRTLAAAKTGPLNVLTHCNAGWLATVDWGTATAPIYRAVEEGLDLHVWVDETRPRNQGAQLTAWELASHGVPHTLIVDNAGGHLMQRGAVDLVLVGTDRTTAYGDVCNKVGTYLKALAAVDNGVPFYVALPSPSIDWSISDGFGIPIEARGPREVTHVWGALPGGEAGEVRICPEATPAANPGFDVTPARLVTGLITERGVCEASPEGLGELFPERRAE